MKYLVTGAAGFVGHHLIRLLHREGHEVCGIDRQFSEKERSAFNYRVFDITNSDSIGTAIKEERPDVLIHLAGVSNVPYAWEHIEQTFSLNTVVIANIIRAVALYSPNTLVLNVGSSEEYGFLPQQDMPLSERSLTNPLNPYGISKLASGHLALRIAQLEGVNAIHVRPFNHIGPGQRLGFVTADFASQVAKIESGIQAPVIRVGNLTAKRDFTDVRDVVRAYYLLSLKGRAGEIYNVASGQPVSMQTILDMLISLASVHINIETVPNLVRKVDIPEYFGSAGKLIRETGWSREISLKQSLQDILHYWRSNTNQTLS